MDPGVMNMDGANTAAHPTALERADTPDRAQPQIERSVLDRRAGPGGLLLSERIARPYEPVYRASGLNLIVAAVIL